MKIFNRRNLIKLSFIIIIMTVYLTYINIEHTYPQPNQEQAHKELQRRLQILVAQEKGTGCVMPKLDPFASEITKFDQIPETIVCEGEDWVECLFNECYVKKMFLDKMAHLTCTYRDLIYVDDYNHYLGKAVNVEGNSKYYLNISDHVKVWCKGTPIGGLGLIANRWQGYKAGFRPVKRPVDPPGGAFNVFMFMLDSMSRNEFIRLMPITYKTLTNELKAVVMDTYNIVGHATDGALLPILTGHNELEMPDWRKLPTNSKRIDPKYFIFSKLEEYGYRTAYFEDMPWIHVFNYRYNGFLRPPADHYTRALFQTEKDRKEFMNFLSKVDQCFGAELMLQFMMEYSVQLMKMSGKKFCVTLSASHTHDPHSIYISQLDEWLAQVLRKFQLDGHLEDTLLFVMGDHGQRFSYRRNTYQGKLEERLPLVSVVLPERLKEERPEAFNNLVANSKVLTTPFDLHTTILDALGLKEYRNKHKVPGADIERGMSLLEHIPESRSCAEAGVMPHWCACEQWHNVSVGDNMHEKVASQLAEYVNQMTELNRLICAKRNLLSVLWVYRKGVKTEMVGFKAALPLHEYIGRYDQTHLVRPDFEYYQAKIVMDPSEAIFEGTMLYNTNENSFSISPSDVSRVNKYGNEPRCVARSHPHLAPYCYCV